MSTPKKPKPDSHEKTMKHRLKTNTEHFQSVLDGSKTFEIRLNDRDFKEGDILYLVELGEDRTNETGRFVYSRVSHILHGPIYGLRDGWCIMSLSAK